jgi:predicted RNase H-like HicB family nuclease
MIKKYAILIEKGETNFGAYVPNLPGCVAVGKTLKEVKQLIQEAIEFHLGGMLLGGESIPEPTTQAHEVEIDLERVRATVALEQAQTKAVKP